MSGDFEPGKKFISRSVERRLAACNHPAPEDAKSIDWAAEAEVLRRENLELRDALRLVRTVSEKALLATT